MAAILEFQPGYQVLPGGPPRPRLTVVPGSSLHMQAVYRRRRILAALLAVLLIMGVLACGRAVASALAPSPPGSGAAEPASVEAGTSVVVVQPGDTLWAIARRLQPSGDVRPLVDVLARAHGSGPLQAGERLLVPD